jgi:hypothetical protein
LWPVAAMLELTGPCLTLALLTFVAKVSFIFVHVTNEFRPYCSPIAHMQELLRCSSSPKA